MQSRMLLLVALIVSVGCGRTITLPKTSPELPPLPVVNEAIPEVPPLEKKVEVEPLPESSNELPRKVLLDVVFASQAPFRNWSMPYQEACEEASLIMAAHYFKKQPLERQQLNQEIIDLIAWEVSELGYYEDTTAEETAQVAREYFGLEVETTEEVTVERIQRELAAGHLIIPPFAGRQLPNPYFRQPGPRYHMLVIKGYDARRGEFITNDPGTNTKGEGLRYAYDDLLNAVHDWNGGNVDEGRRVMLIVKGYVGVSGER